MKLWVAGVLAVLGGLQHGVLIGLPAVCAGLMATRASKRVCEPLSRGVFREILFRLKRRSD
jgi:hypothetical protein